MRQTDPTHYTDVAEDAYDRFKLLVKAHGANISGNEDDILLDRVAPVHVKYNKDAKTLEFVVTQPFFLGDGMVEGFLHTLVAKAMTVPENIPLKDQNNNLSNTDPQAPGKASTLSNAHRDDGEAHPRTVSRTAHETHAAHSKPAHAAHSASHAKK